jgi:tRNA dimethylallyltransferase
MMDGAPAVLALVGPTAAGKTGAAIEIAEDLGAEIVSVDSMLVYRGMDVGTAKPTAEQRARVPHHLIDLAEPSERFTVARYRAAAERALEAIARRGRRSLLVGGSGLYFRAAVDPLEFPAEDADVRGALEREAELIDAGSLHRRLARMDPAAASKIEPENVRRTVRALEVAAVTGRPFSSFATSWSRYPPERVRAAGVSLSSEALYRRIDARVRAMLDGGFLDEVRGLTARGFGEWLTSSQAIGYAEMAAHLDGDLTFEEAVDGTVKRTKALARRQMAWFRRDPRVRWFEAGAEGAGPLAGDIRRYLETT